MLNRDMKLEKRYGNPVYVDDTSFTTASGLTDPCKDGDDSCILSLTTAGQAIPLTASETYRFIADVDSLGKFCISGVTGVTQVTAADGFWMPSGQVEHWSPKDPRTWFSVRSTVGTGTMWINILDKNY